VQVKEKVWRVFPFKVFVKVGVQAVLVVKVAGKDRSFPEATHCGVPDPEVFLNTHVFAFAPDPYNVQADGGVDVDNDGKYVDHPGNGVAKLFGVTPDG